ncbi:MAG TPA: peptidoglycan editing factor PgeF [Bryobacteraceae bacterium]|nr:peptidoglycan editing factor PgeF [Bryobacteraceae bacterium]
MFRIDHRGVYLAQPLEDLAWLAHGFGTRSSSEWPPADTEVATLRQVHSDIVLLADWGGSIGEGDALITDRPGITLAIRTADCLPILIADPSKRAVAAVHAGWRGTVLGIVPKTMRAMQEQFGSRPEDLVVVVGPGIGGCCFEVGPEVAVQFSEFFPERAGLSGRARIDLVETVRRQWGRNDGATRQFAAIDLCSMCRADLFHSYRRDREAAGRMVSVIGIL